MSTVPNETPVMDPHYIHDEEKKIDKGITLDKHNKSSFLIYMSTYRHSAVMADSESVRLNVPRDRTKRVCQYCKNLSESLFVQLLRRHYQQLFRVLVSSL